MDRPDDHAPPTRPSRRDLLRGLCCAPFAAVGLPRLHWLPGGDDRVLVVLELEGGNDGLNTLIPLDDREYARLRPRLGAVRAEAMPLQDGWGLHRALAGLHACMLADAGCAVHAVGYPDPDRSHFRSRDIWQTADPGLQRVQADTTGWLGRAADHLAAAGAALPAATIGGSAVPLVLHARRAVVPLLQRVEDYQILPVRRDAAAGDERRALLELLGADAGAASPAADGELHSWIAALSAEAANGSERLRAALQRYVRKADYPDTPLGRHLQLVARVAVAGTGTRLFHVSLGGFDTHARQLPTHAGLLRQVGDAVAAFVGDLRGHGRLERTALLVHSEFGRRVAENQSQGTDHGAAAPVFLVGGAVRPGLHGVAPDLGRLLDGDVPAGVDFRQVYVALLRWLGLPADLVAGGAALPPLDLMA